MGVQRGVQSVFRAANERLRSRMEGVSYRGRRPVICECGDPDCMEILELTRDEYQRVRDQGNFVVATGHAAVELEHVVERRDGFDVARKD
jgi:hypothetical protein